MVCGFFGYDSLMVTDDLKHIRWYNAKSRYLKSMRPKLENSMEGINAIIKLNENPRYWHIMYDKYRNVYYRFAEMPSIELPSLGFMLFRYLLLALYH